MTYEQMRRRVLGCNAQTLMARRFRQAFGIEREQQAKERKARRKRDDRKLRKDVLDCMGQRIGALDRR